MAVDPKNPPLWLRNKVFEINMTLVNDCDMSWTEIIEFWEGLIADAKNKIDE